MMNIVVTGANGFIGRNLVTALQRRTDEQAVHVIPITSASTEDDLRKAIGQADIVYHLAGVNRPPSEDDFHRYNTGLTQQVISAAEQSAKAPLIVFSSSTQAERDNPYGISKRAAETALADYHGRTANPVVIYRLPNVFGKWSRPHYNSVVATFCYQIARDLDIQINDPDYLMTLVYVDEVVRCFLHHLDQPRHSDLSATVHETFQITVGELAERLHKIHSIRQSLKIPDLSDRLTKYLYSTYLSFLPEDRFAYGVQLRTDDRGWLFELLKSDTFGQMFVSTTKPGITRGNHYHDTKIEKFCLIQGQGVIRFRQIDKDQIIEYPVNDQQIQVVDIPPGYTHSIENVGNTNMIVLFWANEVFDPEHPDTYWVPVIE